MGSGPHRRAPRTGKTTLSFHRDAVVKNHPE